MGPPRADGRSVRGQLLDHGDPGGHITTTVASVDAEGARPAWSANAVLPNGSCPVQRTGRSARCG
eukprot:12559094-Alexandrium_andersonii.AAC.1